MLFHKCNLPPTHPPTHIPHAPLFITKPIDLYNPLQANHAESTNGYRIHVGEDTFQTTSCALYPLK